MEIQDEVEVQEDVKVEEEVAEEKVEEEDTAEVSEEKVEVDNVDAAAELQEHPKDDKYFFFGKSFKYFQLELD